MLSYKTGVALTLWMAGVSAIVSALCFMVLRVIQHSNLASTKLFGPSMDLALRPSEVRWRAYLGIILRGWPLAGVYFLLLAVALYPVVNIWMQWELYTQEVLRREFAEGVFQLRIVSLIAVCASAIYFIRGFSDSHSANGKTVGQYSFYFIVLGALWYVRIYGASYSDRADIWGMPPGTLAPILLQVCSWLLFFVIDDWIIIAQYTAAFSKPPLWHHGLRVSGSNVVFIILLSYILIGITHWTVVAAVFVGQVACLAYGWLDQRARSLERAPAKLWRKLIGRGVPFH